MKDNIHKIKLGDREITLIGTAHVSKESVDEVRRTIEEERPDLVCIELDAGRYQGIKGGSSWTKLDISQVLKQKKGFLLLANLAMSSFQKKIGADLGTKPGEEMVKAIEICEELNIPFELSDREIQVTLRRAWALSNFWNKNKMLAALISSIFTNEEIDKEEIEKLKESSALGNMMEELSGYLPSVKKVLIDERDQYLATKIFNSKGNKVVAVIGAGHAPGIITWLNDLHEKKRSSDLEEISHLPKKSVLSKILPWFIPLIVVGVIGAGFFFSGKEVGIEMIKRWVIFNGGFSALLTLAVLGHPLSILVSFVLAPFTSLNVFVGAGMFAGLTEAFIKKPKVEDFESLQDDITTVKGFFKNRVTHILIVFLASSIGSAIGTFTSLVVLPTLLGK
ncbi:TraB/GumN family protein [Spirochaeta cellobiosiphila]|uniref:TraB/GumN family protein n=1 Tax=Spirochaeta cellobiosiphila TaxID=504483 RepID=UPI0003F84C08|nr:TraB/GumN family protein [Spirochaeta cellobiosiphila]